MNKIIFNTWLISTLEQYKMIPIEIIGGCRGILPVYVALNKKLQEDIANQTKLSSIIVSADAFNYFNRVAYLSFIRLCYYLFWHYSEYENVSNNSL